MKKQSNPFSILFLISIYCLSIGLSVQKTVVPKNFIEEEKQEKQFSALSNALCFYTTNTETAFSVITEYATPNFNSNLNDFWAVFPCLELHFGAKFKQYNNYLKTILVRYRKSDLIFPFHNFW
ncbi:hypothetical protein Q4595_14440 [Wenyingzhuangia sp. 1_MG-2023]|nr:hypothetical protein [Wenyingzhuangia sp. 1_MG-2023]